MTDTWWNSSYAIRRQLTVEDEDSLEILADSPVAVILPYAASVSSSKIREDLEDVEILYWDESLATPSWVILPRNVTIDEEEDTATVVFNTLYDIEESDSNYFLYLNNYMLRNAEDRGSYDSTEFSRRVLPSDGENLTFTRPEEDWSDGVSLRAGARAAFSFMGKSVRLAVETGPDKGIMEFRLDDEDPVYIDTYSEETASEEIIYTTSTLDPTDHYIRLKVIGSKSISSSDFNVKLEYFEYSRYVEAELGTEEVNPELPTISSIVGP